MAFLGKLFGHKSSVEKLRLMLERRRYAEALALAEDLLDAGEASDELRDLQGTALDGLAELNLDEGERYLQAGNVQRGEEHLQLALTQARDRALIARIEAAVAQISEVAQPEEELPESEDSSAAARCDSCVSRPQTAEIPPAGIPAADLPDLQSHLELILASYPPEFASRYLARSSAFLEAFLLMHDGEDSQAQSLWQQLPEAEQDSLYLFELGSLCGRLGEKDRGVELLRQALKLEPGHLLAVEALLTLLLEQGDLSAALEMLQQQLDAGADAGFCHARRCYLQLQTQDVAAAFDSARKSLAAGFSEPDFLVLAARLFEQADQTDQAEQLLSCLPGGGCGGGVNLELAEFWLRQNRELARALDAFNGACRQEPDNPRWQLRVAQTYLARDWRKQGLELLQRVVGDPRLDEPLRLEAEQLLTGA